jgi:hypothetical protein
MRDPERLAGRLGLMLRFEFGRKKPVWNGSFFQTSLSDSKRVDSTSFRPEWLFAATSFKPILAKSHKEKIQARPVGFLQAAPAGLVEKKGVGDAGSQGLADSLHLGLSQYALSGRSESTTMHL